MHGVAGLAHVADGLIHVADGLAHVADGLIHVADGLIHGADGPMHGADGPMHGADGLIHGADGLIHGADGLAHGADGLAHGAGTLAYMHAVEDRGARVEAVACSRTAGHSGGMTALPLLVRVGAAVRSAPARSSLVVVGLLGALTGLGGCLVGPVRCESDADCGDEMCARNGECTRDIVFVQYRWNVAGRAPTSESCAAHPWLSLTFEDRDIADELVYEPIRCTLGQITFDRMPGRYESVVLRANDPAGETVSSHRSAIEPPGITVEVDLAAQAAPVD
jgi:tetraspanin-3